MLCPKCNSKHMHQKSVELVEYCLESNEVSKIYWNSEFQTYECQDCGHSFNTMDLVHEKLEKAMKH